MELKAFQIARPKTNLVQDQAYSVSDATLKTGFLGVFRKVYTGDARKVLLKLALGAFMDTRVISLAKPTRAVSQEERKAKKAMSKALSDWENNRQEMALAQYTTLVKFNTEAPYFKLELPILAMNSVDNLFNTLQLFTDVPPAEETLEEIRVALASGGKRYPVTKLFLNSGLDNGTKSIFSTTLEAAVIKAGTPSVLYLEFKIPKEVVEFLTSTDWLQVRAVDLYPLVSAWVEAEYVSKYYGKSAISMSRISETLPKHDPLDERVDQYSIAINMDGDPLYIPSVCDNTTIYESTYASASVGENGEFALRTPKSNMRPRLPSNLPILVDWINNKFSYSDTSGKIQIMPMEHFRKCTPTMAMNLLNRNVNPAFLKGLVNFAAQCSVPTNVSRYLGALTAEETAEANAKGYLSNVTIDQYFEKVWEATVKEQPNFVLRYADFTAETDQPGFLPVVEFIYALHEGMTKNLEALYAKYAVVTITSQLGIISLLACYGSKISQVRAEANEANKGALNQGVIPDWTPPDAPLLTDKFSKPDAGLQPHQVKIRCLLRESPDLAVLDVAAGGGKSLLAITDVLYEIKANRSAPYLIMCPGHLVANYVSELVEFTDGQVNVIPITSYNFRTSGIARYEQILKAAPINTVMIVDYDALKFRARSAGYGTSSILVFPVTELIRQFRPGYVFLDESHFLKNAKSARAKAVMSLIADIPKKRIASGTLNPDSPSDLPGQMAILDPTIFGTRNDFNQTYGENVSGDRVMQWRTSGENSIAHILPKLKGSVVWASAKRREWAYALPKREDRFISVELTANQKVMYDAIFDDMIQQIKKLAETDKGARKLLEKLNGKKASAEDEENFGDMDEADEDANTEDILDDNGDVGPALQPYLADIERFVTDPASHPYSVNGFKTEEGKFIPPLSGDDLKSPKAMQLARLLTDWFENNTSKAIVFVNYNASAASLFASMPPELQKCGLLYSASQKTEHVNRFKKDPNIKWMIGIRKSLEVGLNLQIAGYLARVEGVWTPGEQEQGDCRIARPYFGKGGDQRQRLRFDTLVANRTIDVTKAARLRAKIVALAKFDNSTDPAYQSIEDIPIIPMNLEAIQTKNDFDTNLAQYQRSMQQLNSVVTSDYEEYKAKQQAEGGVKFTPIKVAPVPTGAAILSAVPYAQGTELYAASELGLVRVDNYLGLELSTDDEDDDSGPGGDDEDETGAKNPEIRRQKELLAGKRVHTEYGDGFILSAGRVKGESVTALRVSLDDGTVVSRLRVTNAFIITRTETNSNDMKIKLAEAAGLPVTGEITAPAVYSKPAKLTLKQQREIAKEQERQRLLEKQKARKKEGKLSIGLDLTIVNGYVRLGYIESSDKRAVKALEALGFKLEPKMVHTRIRNHKQLITQFRLWADAGFNVSTEVDSDAFITLAQELDSNALQTHKHYAKLMGKAAYMNYMRLGWKPTSNPKLLQMFALVTDGGDRDAAALREAAKAGVAPRYGVAYLAMPYGAGHPATAKAMSSRYKAPSTNWVISNPSLSIYAANIGGIHKILGQLKDAGISVNNIDQLNVQAKSIRKLSNIMELKNDATVDIGPAQDPKAVAEEKVTKKTR